MSAVLDSAHLESLQIYNAQYVSREFQEEKLLIVFNACTVCNDKDTLHYKGPTVMSMKERVEAIENCKWVQQVIPNSPWILDEAFLERHDIDLVAHDDIPYAAPGQDDVYGWVSCSSYGISRIALTLLSVHSMPPITDQGKGQVFGNAEDRRHINLGSYFKDCAKSRFVL